MDTAPARPRLRIAEPSDAGAIAEVHAEGWRWGYRGLMPEPLLEAVNDAGRVARWERVLSEPSTTVWLAEHEAGVVAFLAAGAIRGGPESEPADRCEVYALYQRQGVAGTGVARALFTHALAALRLGGARGVVLWVLSSNDRARRFYEHAGLQADGPTKIETLLGVELPHIRYVLAFGPREPG